MRIIDAINFQNDKLLDYFRRLLLSSKIQVGSQLKVVPVYLTRNSVQSITAPINNDTYHHFNFQDPDTLFSLADQAKTGSFYYGKFSIAMNVNGAGNSNNTIVSLQRANVSPNGTIRYTNYKKYLNPHIGNVVINGSASAFYFDTFEDIPFWGLRVRLTTDATGTLDCWFDLEFEGIRIDV